MRTNLKYLMLALFIIPTSLFAQNYWKLGGNNNLPPSAVNTANNILGTKVNLPIRIFTNNIIQSMFTSGNTFGSGDGLRFIGGNCNNYLDMWATKGAGCETTVKFHVNG